jgi:hypothetical protein
VSTRYWRRLDVKAEPYVIEVDGDVRSERDVLVAASLGLAREKSDLEKELTGVRDQLAAAVRRSEQDRTNAGALQLRYDEMRRERDDLLARLSQGERP